MKRDMDFEDEKAKCDTEITRARSQVDQAVEFVMSIRKDLTKLLKQVEKKQQQYSLEEEEENKSLNIRTLNNGESGKKLILTSLTETFKRSVDNLVKRVESYLYFSTVRQQEPLYTISEKPNCKTTTTLENLTSSAVKKQISGFVASSTAQKRGGADFISTLGSHYHQRGADEHKPNLTYQVDQQYSSRY